MRWFVPLLVALLAGCSACGPTKSMYEQHNYELGPRVDTFDETLMLSEYCYDVLGVMVGQYDTVCPDKKVVKTTISRLFHRVGAEDDALKGAMLVFTNDTLTCAGTLATGCADYSTDIMVVRAAFHYGKWGKTIAHECMHLLTNRNGLGVDLIHTDDDIRNATFALNVDAYMLLNTKYHGAFHVSNKAAEQ